MKQYLSIGAKTEEVIVMNGLTVNLHLLLVSFSSCQNKITLHVF